MLFLPPYSPNFSSIEEAFSKLKAFLRRVGARTREALQDALIQALLTSRQRMLMPGLVTVAISMVPPGCGVARMAQSF